MGNKNLHKMNTSLPVPAGSEQYDDIIDSFSGDIVTRNLSGVVEDGCANIGGPGEYGRPDTVNVKSGMTVAGKQIDFSTLNMEPTCILSGKSKVSGFPDYLYGFGMNAMIRASGAGNNLRMNIESIPYTLEVDRGIIVPPGGVAPGVNNTATVNDAIIAGDPDWSRTIGEYGYWITVDDPAGSEINALDGTIQCFKIDNGAETEIFIGKVNVLINHRIIPILRGVAGTSRIVFSDGDTLTLLKTHYCFFNKNMSDIYLTTRYPWRQESPPASGYVVGDYYQKTNDQRWYRWSGATWEAYGDIFLGYFVCDDTEIIGWEQEHFRKQWGDLLKIDKIEAISITEIEIVGLSQVQVCEEKYFFENVILDTASAYISGESKQTFAWDYIYLLHDGSIKLSVQAPRRYDFRRGWYHPSEYYRCIGTFGYDGGTNLYPFKNDPGLGTICLWGPGTSFIAGPWTKKYMHLPTIISKATFRGELAFPDLSTECTIRFKGLDRIEIVHGNMYKDKATNLHVAWGFTSELFRNALLNVEVGNFNLSYMYVNEFEIKF